MSVTYAVAITFFTLLSSGGCAGSRRPARSLVAYVFPFPSEFLKLASRGNLIL
ncbi:MAG: hypothetical protein U1G07_14160 [Verrucomicrobiota bacterium]